MKQSNATKGQKPSKRAFLVRREAAVSSVSHSVRHETVRQDGGTDGGTLELAGRRGEFAGR